MTEEPEISVFAAVVVGFLGLLYIVRKYFKGGVCTSKARLDGKTAIITGANTGIGKETAKDLAARGARVILGCRDLEKAKVAAEEIWQHTGNSNVIVKKLDLASLQSVREFVEEIKKEETHLEILINNAGVFFCPYSLTNDGYEMHFAVNHLGHFLLTVLLLDLLKRSAPSRIVIVSALLHLFGKINFEDINSEKKYSRFGAYCNSKLANLLFARQLHKQLSGSNVTINCLHPGVINSGLGRHIPGLGILQVVTAPLHWLFLKTLEGGAQTTIHCAVAEELENVSGLYFSDCAPIATSAAAGDDDAACRLWDLSCEMAGVEVKSA